MNTLIKWLLARIVSKWYLHIYCHSLVCSFHTLHISTHPDLGLCTLCATDDYGPPGNGSAGSNWECLCPKSRNHLFRSKYSYRLNNFNVDLSNALVLTRIPLLSVECRTNLPRFRCQRKMLNDFDLNIACIICTWKSKRKPTVSEPANTYLRAGNQ